MTVGFRHSCLLTGIKDRIGRESMFISSIEMPYNVGQRYFQVML